MEKQVYLYSGTSQKIIGELRYPIFATKLMWYAKIYALGNCGSSRCVWEQGGEPKIIRFKLSSNLKTLDLKSNAKQIKLFNDKYWGKWSQSESQTPTNSGYPDWTEGDNILDFIEEEGLDLDVVLLDEGGHPDPNSRDVVERGISYMILNPKVKLDKVTYLDK